MSGRMDGLHNMSAWQWYVWMGRYGSNIGIWMKANIRGMDIIRCMLIWGCITAFSGIVYFFFLPDKPKSRWFRLTPEEEKIIDDRTRDNTVVRSKIIKREHMLEALKEPRFYCCMLISFFLNLQNGCITIFSTQIIKNMGFTVSKMQGTIGWAYLTSVFLRTRTWNRSSSIYPKGFQPSYYWFLPWPWANALMSFVTLVH